MAGKPITRERAAIQAEKLRLRDGKRKETVMPKKTAAQIEAKKNGTAVHGHPPDAWVTLLTTLSELGRLDLAVQRSGISRHTVYARRRTDSVFAALYEEHRAVGFERLEDIAYKRATEGTQKPVFHQGTICGHINEYSDSLIMFMLQANDSRYRKQSEVNLKGGLKLETLSDAELAEMHAAKIAELAAIEADSQ